MEHRVFLHRSARQRSVWVEHVVRQYAIYRLGACLHMSFQLADINRTAADRAYVAEVAKRINEVTSPEGRELFARWLEPGGVLRLWPK
jgi:hypothetical protein